MTFIQPGWLGLPALIIIVVTAALVATAVLYVLVPPARRFIKGERPVWWVRDGFLAVFVAVLLIFGHSYVLRASDRGEQGQSQGHDQGQAQRISNLDFVRSRSSDEYRARPFRGFDLRDMNLAGLELRGADFTGANLGGANLAGTRLNYQNSTPEAPGQPAIPAASTYLQGVNLCRAVLTGADLGFTYLVNANLIGVDLSSTSLRGAVLNGADLSGATMPADFTYLEGIYYDDTTTWPEGFQPPPANPGDKFGFLENPINNALYGDIQRPTCNS